MILRLQRPLVFLDFETTGLDTQKDRIVELAFVRLLPDGTRTSLVQRINPGVDISKAATKVTGIHSQDAMGLFWGPPLKKVGQKLVGFLDGCDLAGFNQIHYDMPLWLAECRRHNIAFESKGRHQVDARIIFNAKEPGWDRFLMGPRNLSAAVRHYCGRELEGAHGAEADCHATVDVLLAQLQRHPDLPRDVPGLDEFCSRNQKDEDSPANAGTAKAWGRTGQPAGQPDHDRPAHDRRGAMIFSKRYRYRFGDIDDAGIAYYPKLLHYFHCCFEDWFGDAFAIAYARVMHEQKLGLPAVRLEADFFAPIRYGDEPEVHLGVLRMGNSSVEFGFWMSHSGEAPALCRARVVTAAVHMDTMQKRTLPEEWRARFLQFAITEAEFPAGR